MGDSSDDGMEEQVPEQAILDFDMLKLFFKINKNCVACQLTESPGMLFSGQRQA
jgi:hypothetical protein